MGMKIAAAMAAVLFTVCGLSYWYYQSSQATIATLRENNAQLEVAVDTAEASINSLQADMAKFAEANSALQKQLQQAEAYGDELQEKLRRHDLTALALRKPKLLEGKMNGATANLWRELEEVTGGDGSQPLPKWLQSDSEGTGNQDSDQNREDSSATGGETQASTTD